MNPRRAFTLIELLVAVGITAVLAAVLLGLVSRTLGLWERSASALVVENEAGLILDHLTVDLETAFRGDVTGAAAWLQYSETGDNLTELRLIAAAATTSGQGDDPNTLREVAYQWVAGSAAADLYRWEGTARETLDNAYAWLTWPAVPDDEFLLGSRLERLEITFWNENREELLAVDGENWPTLARVELSLLTPDGVERMEAVGQGLSNEPTEQIRAEASRQFVRWVKMGGHR